MSALRLIVVLSLLLVALGATIATPASADHCSSVWTHNAYHQHSAGWHTGYHQFRTCYGVHSDIVHTH